MLCIHHNDLDGCCAAAVVAHAFSGKVEKIEFREVDYSSAFPFDALREGEKLYIVDFSVKPEVMHEILKITNDVHWIDHHKTAAEYYYGTRLKGLRDFTEPGKSGALLTWEYLETPRNEVPLAVSLTSDYDTWQHALAGSTEFNLGVMMQPWSHHPSSLQWGQLLESEDKCKAMITAGEQAKLFRQQKCEDYCRSYGYETEIGGKRAFAVNLYTFGSHTFGQRMREYPICAGYVWNGSRWTVSLYSDLGVDTSVISKGFGGGGHSGASGFVCDDLPFKPINWLSR